VADWTKFDLLPDKISPRPQGGGVGGGDDIQGCINVTEGMDDMSESELVLNDQFVWNKLRQHRCHEVVSYKDVANQTRRGSTVRRE